MRQLHAEGRSYEQVGQAMGVTKARAYQVGKGRAVDDPAYAWGRALSVLEALAYSADRLGGNAARTANRYHGEAGQLVSTGLATTTVRPRVDEAASRYAKRIANFARTDAARATGEALARRLGELTTDSESLPTGYMTMGRRAQVVLGYHHERNEREALRTVEAE